MDQNQSLPAVQEPGRAVATSDYAVCKASDMEIQALVSELQGIKTSDLDRVKIPSGGALFFEVPNPEGPTPEKKLKGVIVATRDTRVFWAVSMRDREGPPTPPDCKSEDAINGFGVRWENDKPGQHSCEQCPLSQFVDRPDGKREPPRCKEKKLVFLLQSDSLIPVILVLPPTSIKATKEYVMRLLRKNIFGVAVETEYELTSDKSDAGDVFSRAVPKLVRRLEKPEIEALGRLVPAFKKLFATVKVTDVMDEATPQGPQSGAVNPPRVIDQKNTS